jgi:UPF0716 protein FxsA
MPFLLLALLILLPVAELYVLIRVGEWIGALPTILALIAASVVGALLVRAEGRRAWLRFQKALAAGRIPARETFDGFLILTAGALLITPGFLTDVFGVVLLLPPTRAMVRWVLMRNYALRFVARVGRARYRAPRRDDDIEGTATEFDPRRLP